LLEEAMRGVIGLALFAVSAAYQGQSVMLGEIRAHNQGIALWWTGNDGWLIKSGGILISTDLDLGSGGKLKAPPITAQELAGELDVAFVTHHHGDHCNGLTIKALAAGKCAFVLPRKCRRSVADAGISDERIIVPEPGRSFEIKGIQVEPIHAIHGNQEFSILTREPDFLESMAYSCGYIFNIGGKRFLQPGDSVLTEQHLGLKGIDVLFVSPTVHNMYIDRSMILINKLQPAYIFPQHFETYSSTEENSFWTKGYPDELRLRLSRDLQMRYQKPSLGQKFLIR
jgi:L-ascorbate metabolism protein UlaG (beta-lactamase superfamily)